jgi:hypothetical protein
VAHNLLLSKDAGIKLVDVAACRRHPIGRDAGKVVASFAVFSYASTE